MTWANGVLPAYIGTARRAQLDSSDWEYIHPPILSAEFMLFTRVSDDMDIHRTLWPVMLAALFQVGGVSAVEARQVVWPASELYNEGLQREKDGDIQEALQIMKQAAEQGNASAMDWLGHAYNGSRLAPRDHKLATEYFRQAAELGEPNGMLNYGLMLRVGQGVEVDVKAAREWLRRAQRAGSPRAREVLREPVPPPGGWLYDMAWEAHSRGDLPRAAVLWREAAEIGFPGAMNNLALAYLNGTGVQFNFTLAEHWYTRAIEAGDTTAVLNLVRLHWGVNGSPYDERLVRQLLRRAIRDGINVEQARSLLAEVEAGERATDAPQHLRLREAEALWAGGDQDAAIAIWREMEAGNWAVARYNLAYAYFHGDGLEKDLAKARQLFMLVFEGSGHPGSASYLQYWVEVGDEDVMLFLAEQYLGGGRAQADGWRAREYLAMAAQLGNVTASQRLAELSPVPQDGGEDEYQKGLALFNDDRGAFNWLMQAATKGHMGGMIAVADAYLNGRGVQENLVLARLWYSRAARIGSNYGQQNYAAMLAVGLGGPVDGDAALVWYRMAADAGNVMAMWGLGRMYMSGLGIPKNEELGRYWLEIAAGNGSVRAERTLVAMGLRRDEWGERVARAQAEAEAMRQQERSQQRGEMVGSLAKIWAAQYAPAGSLDVMAGNRGMSDAEFWARAREHSDCMKRVIESIHRMTYGQQTWRYVNNCR